MSETCISHKISLFCLSLYRYNHKILLQQILHPQTFAINLNNFMAERAENCAHIFTTNRNGEHF